MRKLTTEEWIEKAKSVRGDEYIFDEKCIYNGAGNNVTLKCRKHGYFEINAHRFLKGFGCPICTKEKKLLTDDKFLLRAREVHGYKYNYKFINSNDRVIVICPKHGEFEQDKQSHLSGRGCKKCYHESRRNINKKNIENIRQSWIDKFIKVHGDKYDYSKFEFVNANTNSTIICPIHGDFQQNPYSHSKGCGCPKCVNDKLYNKFSFNKEEFIKRARMVHGNKYDYIGEYKNMRTKMRAVCPEHGEFEFYPGNHIYHGQGCPKCGIIKCVKTKTMTTEQFVNRCKAVHGDKYDYSITNYNGWDNHFQYICHKADKNGNEHGIIEQLPSVHILQKCGCPKCSHIVSRAESEIADFVSKYYKVVKNSRKILPSGKELDIYIPSLRIAIEYCGMKWHSEPYKDKNYHVDKLNECNENGIKLITVFEYEFLTNHDLVLGKISHILGINKEKERIYARKCIVKEIETSVSKGFLVKNHIQGHSNGTVHLGCFHGDKLIGVMVFLKNMKNDSMWTLSRFATDNEYICCGVGSKMFKYFTKNYDFTSIVSFADRRWTVDDKSNLYTKLGFSLDKILSPDYHYTKTSYDYIHKFSCRKMKLHKKYGLSLRLTESKMTERLGLCKIWNCGLLRYVYKKEDMNKNHIL